MALEQNAQDNRATRAFISYSRRDAEFVGVLSASLSARGYDVLLDKEDISAGEAWRERLEQLILQADVVIFVLSPASVASEVCDWETRRATELGKRLIPIAWRPIGEVAPPPQLSRLNYIFMETDAVFDAGLSKLCEACDIDIQWVREHTRMVERAAYWEAAGSEAAGLLRGQELAGAERWLARRTGQAPEPPPTLVEYLRLSRAEERASLERERANVKRTQRLQSSIAVVLIVAALVVGGGGIVVARMLSGIGERSARSLASLAQAESNVGNFDAAARYARSGLRGADWPLIGFRAETAEVQLRRALSGPLLHAVQLDACAAFLAVHTGRVGDGRPEERRSGEGHSQNGLTAAAVSEGVLVMQLGNGEVIARFADLGRIVAAAFSADGTLLATADVQRRVRIWDIETQRERGSFEHSGVVSRLEFSADGARLLATSRYEFSPYGEVAPEITASTSVFDLAGRRLRTFSNAAFASFSPDGSHVLAIAGASSARIIDVRGNAAPVILAGHFHSVTAAAFSADGARVATLALDQAARVWDARNGRLLRVLPNLSGFMDLVAFAPAGDRVAIATNTNIVLWNWVSEERVELAGHESGITSMRFSRDGARLLTGSRDSTARLWDVRGANTLTVLRGHAAAVREVFFARDEQAVMTSARDGALRVWSARNDTQLAVLRGDEGVTPWRVERVAYSADGRFIASVGDDDNTVWLWDVRNDMRLSLLRGHGARVLQLAFSPDSQRLATGDAKGAVMLWSLPAGARTHALHGHSATIFDLAFNRDGSELVTASGDMTARIWSVSTGRERGILRGHTGMVSVVSFAPDNSVIASGSTDGEVRLWDAQSLEGVPIFKGSTGIVAAAFAPSGEALVISSAYGGARIWNLTTMTEAARLDESGQVVFAAVSPDGARIVTAASDFSTAGGHTLTLWDGQSGRRLAVIQSPTYVGSAAFSPNGQELATGSDDGVMRLWDVAGAVQLAEFRGHSIAVSDVTFDPTGTRLVSGGGDGTVRVWSRPEVLNIPRTDLIARACGGPLGRGNSAFRVHEMAAAPILDPQMDGDACADVSPLRRLAAYLGAPG